MKRTDIRWNLVFEFNRMNLVQDERTEQEAEKDRKISLVWTAALLVLLLWPLRDEGTTRGFALVDLCAVALRAVLDWRALHGGSFLLTGKTVTAWNGLSRALLGGIWTGAALYYLLGARSLRSSAHNGRQSSTSRPPHILVPTAYSTKERMLNIMAFFLSVKQ